VGKVNEFHTLSAYVPKAEGRPDFTGGVLRLRRRGLFYPRIKGELMALAVEEADLADIDEAGIWTWYLNENILYADTAVARLFGMDPEEALIGLPVEPYLARIHPEDRPDVCRAISDAVVGGQTYHAEYRVTDAFGETRIVISFGRCFRDRTGNPVQYAGISYPLDSILGD
jgi:PAS domain S-box-containing protein